jgi:CRP-like cAMP-binding protein
MSATMTPLLFGRVTDDRVREAAWVARCVGRADTAPLGEADLSALASYLTRHDAERGRVLFAAGKPSRGVWIVRGGMVELAVGAGARRVVVELLHPGDVDGDVELLLGMPFPYTARAVAEVQYLFLSEQAFERLLREHPTVARRWLSSVAARVASGQQRIVGLLGRSLPVQVARLLTEEAVDGRVALPQRTLAAMLGVQRPSLNKVLKQFERQRLVEVGYGEIRVLDPRGLARLTGG